MKVRFKGLAFLAAFLLLSVAAGASDAVESYRLSNQLPPSHHISKGMDLFAEKVKEYSKGEIEIKVLHSAQLFSDAEIVEALQNGLVELGVVPVNKWSGMIPAADIFEMPFVFADLSSPEKFFKAGGGKLLDEAFQEMGAKVVFWVDYGFVQFFNNVRPLRKPEDFKGLKIRAFSKGSADSIEALGGSPVVISSSEMYMALQRGTIDGVTTGMPAAVSRKLYEVLKYMTLCNYSTAQFMVQANLPWWEKLPESTKEVLLKAGNDAEEWIRSAIADSENEAQRFLEEYGLQITTLTPEEHKAFVDATIKVRETFLQQSGTLGKQLLDIALSIQ